jgi:uracil-DNA glycosylase family 4
MLDTVLNQTEIPRNQIAILNCAACGPIPSAADDIKRRAVEACRPRLLAELNRLQPKVILGLGASALKSLSPQQKSGITVLRGAMLDLGTDVATKWKPSGFFTTFHPAHILRGGDAEAEGPGDEGSSAVDLLFYFFLYDVLKAWNVAQGLASPWRDECDLFVHSEEGKLFRATTNATGAGVVGDEAHADELIAAAQRLADEARTEGRFACDVETDGKNSLLANLTAIGFATTLGGLSATWEAWQRVPQALGIMRELLADPHIHIVFHNRTYDTCVLPRHELPVLGIVDDTLLFHHAAFPGLPHKLDQVATQFLITPPWKNEFRKGTKDFATLVLYNFRDAHATALLVGPLINMIKAHKTEKVYEVDRQCAGVATEMRKIGFYVDRVEQKRHSDIQHARLKYMRESLTKSFTDIAEPWRVQLAKNNANKVRKKDPESYLDRVAIRYREIAEREKKPTDIGFFKPKAKADIVALFEVLRIPFTAYTSKGAPITDKNAMELASMRHPLLRQLIDLREAQQLLATYIDGLPVMFDGRLHPDWSVNKVTGRWSAGKTQNVPKQVSSWPPETNDDGTWKRKKKGAYITPIENPRSIVCAPSAAQILSLGSKAHPEVLSRALEGYRRMLFGADSAQQELRIVALISGDKFLLDIFNRGEDPHAAFARIAFPKVFPQIEAELAKHGVKPKDTAFTKKKIAEAQNDIERAHWNAVLRLQKNWSKLRDVSKNGEFGCIYGAGAMKIYETWRMRLPDEETLTLSDAEAFFETCNRVLEGVNRWRNRMETDARLRREIREVLGYRVRLFPLGHFNPNICYNFPVQAFGASLIARAIFRFVALTQPSWLNLGMLYKNGLLDAKWVSDRRAEGYGDWKAPVWLLINGHDSLVGECDEEDAAKAAKLLELAMTMRVNIGDASILFPAEPDVGVRWSEV